MDTKYGVVGFIVAFVGGSSVLLAVIAWLARAIIAQYMSRDLARFTSQLQHTSSIEMERLRHDLRLVASDVEKRSALLNEKRAKVVAGLYRRLVDFVSAAESYANIAGAPHTDATATSLGEKAGDFITYYQHNRIYFSESLCTSLRKLFDTVHGPSRSLRMWEKMAERSGGTGAAALRHDEAWSAAWSVMQTDVPPILADIEKEFRSILGVHVA